MSRTDAILKRLTALYPRFMDLQLDRERRLLAELGHPERQLPPVIHVAGTNGKGSTVAYLRAMLEAAGKRVHVFTSPHLVRFNERIRLAGELVGSRRLNAMLEAVERINAGQPITQFEITTSAALKLFAETPADYLLLEVGMGGSFDSTNIVDHPAGVIITPVDYDHMAYLGNSIAEIAANKAGILKRGSPAVIGRQRDEGLDTIERAAAKLKITPFVQGRDYDGFPQDGRLIYQDEAGLLDLPPPALRGHHQYDNAALAVAAVRHFRLPVSEAQMAAGLRHVVWPARLQPLTGRLRALLPRSAELWLDGGHNAHGAAALALSLEEMQARRKKNLVLIVGMMNTRPPADFLAPFKPMAPRVLGLGIPGEPNSWPARAIADAGLSHGLPSKACRSVLSALRDAAEVPNARVVICGSLYLAGDVLARNGTPPE
ncbi:MAG: bifunctional folylpolyglutamate synthase/dihydrofolate synthase [Devosia sp. 67-54]|uniref:bifunctional folylpolyglutamate synthase/dihydrofolate synthase n=1 Tax=unclassified Devosia TaxID=196773 RepID=UPI00095B6B41|nr:MULTISPECIES: folylpolyglutamate synthase/dihydrofolate synthase family protein [unclassified Devosia]MBN9304940.1 bifunctional folylpolyglutamate synthase/dihydrofolate synthase [Devosia sp.]OJX15115.1 MAG: bifunctional folylpolyglutamate synthase/dihydrofolate synthase [Devosia sp. 67-54]